MSFSDNLSLFQNPYNSEQNFSSSTLNTNYFDLSAPFPEKEFDYFNNHSVTTSQSENPNEMDVIPQEPSPSSQPSANVIMVNTQIAEYLLRIELLETTCELKCSRIKKLEDYVGELQSQRIHDINRIGELETKVAENRNEIAERKIQTTNYVDKLETQLTNNLKQIRSLEIEGSIHQNKIKELETRLTENLNKMEEQIFQSTNYIQKLKEEIGNYPDKIRSLEVEREFHVSKIKQLEKEKSENESKLGIYRENVRGLEFQVMHLNNQNLRLSQLYLQSQQNNQAKNGFIPQITPK